MTELALGVLFILWMLRGRKAADGTPLPPKQSGAWKPTGDGSDASDALREHLNLPQGSILVGGHDPEAVGQMLAALDYRNAAYNVVDDLSALDEVILDEKVENEGDIRAANLVVVATSPTHRPGSVVIVGVVPPDNAPELIQYIDDPISYSTTGAR